STLPEQNAARELSSYIEKISGARLPVEEAPSDTACNIFVGQTAAAMSPAGDCDWDSLRGDGILIRSGKGYLILAGDRPRGTLYAVYTFLEDCLGVRFWAPDAERVPGNKTIRISDRLDRAYTPPFFSREAYFNLNMNNNAYAIKQKSNGHHNRISEDLGGHVTLMGWAHTFGGFISAQEYFGEHPEWFSLRDGKRVGGNTQLCLSNDECVRELGSKVLEALRKEDHPTIISVTQNDNDAYCTCDKCAALAEKYGAQSGLILHAVNQVADRVKEEFPDVLVETFAYWYTVDAPKNIKPRDNVIIRLCDIRNNFGTPLAECLSRRDDPNQQTNLAFYKSLQEWSSLTDNLFIWNYIVNFTNYYIIHPNFHCLKPDLQVFRDHHAKAIFEQGDSFNATACFNVLKQYLTAKLLWDPDIDDDACIREFLEGYYGEAAPYLYNVIDRCEKEVARQNVYLACYMGNLSWMPTDAFVYCFDNFNKGLSAVSGDPALRERVLGELLSFQWGWYLLGEDERNAVRDSGCLLISDEDRYMKCFYDWQQRHDNRYSREGGLFAPAAASTSKELKRSDHRPEGLSEEDGWFEVAGDDFDLHITGSCSFSEEDPAASQGVAAGLRYNSTEWAVQRRIEKAVNKAVNDGWKKAEVYIVCRRQGELTASPDSNGCNVIFYDEVSGAYPGTFSIKAGDIKSDYTVIKAGELELKKYGGLMVALALTPDANLGESLLTDRIYFVLRK
ncbi:MAG: DUF4838 domain-containing protein, partial [Abditibacteriota bacterium]|nr:DUF4838 domain-containing protein [Abditibacteriota bacterium]